MRLYHEKRSTEYWRTVILVVALVSFLGINIGIFTGKAKSYSAFILQTDQISMQSNDALLTSSSNASFEIPADTQTDNNPSPGNTDRATAGGGDSTTPLALSPGKRISYKVITKQRHHNILHKNSFNTKYRCISQDGTTPVENRSHVRGLEAYFSAYTQVASNLNFIFAGDSVNMLIGEAFLGSTNGMDQVDMLEVIKWPKTPPVSWMAASAPVAGGGAVCVWRMCGLFSRVNENKPTPNKGPGWKRQHLLRYMNYTEYHWPATNDTRYVPSSEHGQFKAVDVIVNRLSYPWMRWGDMTGQKFEAMIESIDTVVKPEVIIFVSPHFLNNIKDLNDLAQLRKANKRLWGFINSWRPNYNVSGVKHVLIADYYRLVEEVSLYAGKQMGYEVERNEFYKMDSLNHTKDATHWKKITSVCSERVESMSETCTHNLFLNDGVHMCIETLAGRMSGVIACLTECAYHPKEREIIRGCEKRCNDRFMGLGGS